MSSEALKRKAIHICGNVHGSPLQPAVFRIVRTLNLKGWMRPQVSGFDLELEGDESTLVAFEKRMLAMQKRHGWSISLQSQWLAFQGDTSFENLPPLPQGDEGCWLTPDRTPCPDCVAEMFNPHQRRFFYPYTSCTECGPRYSWARQGLMDRSQTILSEYVPCEQCQAEANQSRDRRFLYPLNACATCGPSLSLQDAGGRPRFHHREALIQAAACLDRGQVLVVEEPHGYQLVAIARSSSAIKRIRSILGQPHQPAMLLVATPDAADTFCDMHPRERAWMQAPDAPLIRMRHREGRFSLSGELSPSCAFLDVGLPASGVMHLLMHLLDLPLAAFPAGPGFCSYACSPGEVNKVFGGQVDGFLASNLSVLRQTTRSLIWRVCGFKQVLRQGFGMVPIEKKLPRPSQSIMAMGGSALGGFAQTMRDRVFLGQAMDGSEEKARMDAFLDVLGDIKQGRKFPVDHYLVDSDVSQLGVQYARSTRRPCTVVDHDLAHVMGSLGRGVGQERLLGVCFDEGSSQDGASASGGDVFMLHPKGWRRIAQWSPFWLPGGQSSHPDHRACLYGMMWEVFKENLWDQLPLRLRAPLQALEIKQWNQVLATQCQSLRTRSVTRWWQGIAALLTHSNRNRFDGDAWLIMEALRGQDGHAPQGIKPYAWCLDGALEEGSIAQMDWFPMLREMLEDLHKGRGSDHAFQRLVETFYDILNRLIQALKPEGVIFAGNGFENRSLTERLGQRLHEDGIPVIMSQELPLGDQAIAMGQCMAHASFDGIRSHRKKEVRSKKQPGR
ncbi:MAG: Sua5/YciO/YrdC/YwlC family protein [Limisphaerales bacterium]